MQCHLHDASMCVCNLVTLTEERAPISFGLRVGLNNIYGDRHMPPCVRGPVGAAYWSVESEPGDPEGLAAESGPYASFQEVS
jgi:hypothetical protein